MKIRTISISRSRKFNHENEAFSNIQISITLAAEMESRDTRCSVAATLNAQAEESLAREEKRVRRCWQAERDGEVRRHDEKEALLANLKTGVGRLRELDPGLSHEDVADLLDPDLPF